MERIHFRNPTDPNGPPLALTKAPKDINRVLRDLRFEDFSLFPQGESSVGHLFAGIVRACQVRLISRRFHAGTVVFCQPPSLLSWSPRVIQFLRYAQRHGAVVITLLHDIDVARNWEKTDADGLSRRSRDFIQVSDVLISHNGSMTEWLAAHGADRRRIVNLDIFDYFTDGFRLKTPRPFQRSVAIAGNLRLEKAAYLADLGTIDDVQWRLYGPKFDSSRTKGPTIRYEGCYPADEVPQHLNAGFGLVWDGESLDSCLGGCGEYLRINNPHKLSLYLASALPVIVWRESAVASFVKANGVGFAVSSLRDIGYALENLTADEYCSYATNAMAVSKKLRTGWFTKRAISEAMTILSKTYKGKHP